jgi:hypothetical protein
MTLCCGQGWILRTFDLFYLGGMESSKCKSIRPTIWKKFVWHPFPEIGTISTVRNWIVSTYVVQHGTVRREAATASIASLPGKARAYMAWLLHQEHMHASIYNGCKLAERTATCSLSLSIYIYIYMWCIFATRTCSYSHI